VSRQRPLRLLAYTDSGAVGGAELALGYLLHALAGQIEVGVLATDLRIAERIAEHRPGALPVAVRSPRGIRDLSALLEHRAAIRAFAPDVLHCNQAWPWACAYGELAGLLERGVRVLAVDHLPVPGAIPRVRRAGRKLLARRLDAHVSVGVRSAREVEEIVGLVRNTVGAVPNGVPSGSCEARDSPAIDNVSADSGDPLAVGGGFTDSAPLVVGGSFAGCDGLVIGSLGRLTDQKGYDLLVRALPELPSATLVLVGDGPRRPVLEGIAAELGVADRLRITGWVEDAPSRLLEFDIFALPSRWEGMPLSILEAMHAGLPVVACDVGSVGEAVRDGDTGYLLPVEDLAVLRDRLGKLLADAALRKGMGDRARELAGACFTDTCMARRYEAIYSSMAGWWQPAEES
jgi:glycosyltransferase involved in cell wall biosynthesis